ncbi:MAG: carboxypeptidase-like regulatory domain-containing protein [Cyclobacteriaceae bacterium]|nr:carboxypeptidase-like regulatory domain-containing protein [Cyclobacteriaceae bacterium]
MKKQYSISVDRSCNEKWEQFKPTSIGGFCSSCSKNVIDFTSMSDKEVIEMISKSSEKTCGRFKSEQLNRPILHSNILKKTISWNLVKMGIASIPLLLFNQKAFTNPLVEQQVVEVEQKGKQSRNIIPQDNVSYTISGIVVDEYGETLPGVNVILKGTTYGTITDFDGKFKIEVNEGDVLIFAFVGLETVEYKVGKEDFANIEMEMEMTMNCVILGEVALEEVYKSKSNLWSKLKSIF